MHAGSQSGELLPGMVGLLSELIDAVEIQTARLDEMSDYASELLKERNALKTREPYAERWAD